LRNLLRNILKMLTGVFTPIVMTVACLAAVAASIECPRIFPIAGVVVILILCLAKRISKDF